MSTRDKGQNLTVRAFEEARQLGCYRVGAEHLLLALARPDDESPAARALRAAQADFQRIRPVVADWGARKAKASGEPRSRDVQLSTVSLHQAVARAEGLAAGLGEPGPSAEHALLALLWERERTVASLLERIGVTRDAVLEALRGEGTRVPDEPLPALRLKIDWGEAVAVPSDRLDEIQRRVVAALPRSTPIAVTRDGDQAKLRTVRGVDLAALVRESISQVP